MTMSNLPVYQRRALEVLAGSSNGCSELLMLAQGFAHNVLTELTTAGLANVKPERLMMGRKSIEVRRYRISEAGHAELEARDGAF